MSTQPASVVCQIQNNVARITLNRPPLNILINKVFPAATFGEMTGEFLRKLTSLSDSTLRLTKRAVNRGLNRSLSEGIAVAEQLYLGELMRTEDAREDLNAFQEKRKPFWKNQ